VFIVFDSNKLINNIIGNISNKIDRNIILPLSILNIVNNPV